VWLETESAIHIELATSVAELNALADEWLGLWQRDPNATPFQSPAWLIPWAEYFTNGELCCAAVRVDGLAVFLPTFVWRNPETNQRELLLLGTGLSDYVGGLAEPVNSEWFQRALDSVRASVDWDILNFESLRDGSLLLSAAAATSTSVCPVLELPVKIEALPDCIPRAQIQNLHYYRRRAERIGELRFELAHKGTFGSILEELFALHSVRWNKAGQPGMLADPNVQTFHRAAARGLLHIGALRLYRMTVAGETAAVLYGFASHARSYYYLSGFAAQFAAVSPGALIIGHAIEQAVCEDCTHFDFLRGAERYKYLWGAKDTPTFRVQLSRQLFAGEDEWKGMPA
jgi:CelD/BcsL family acetyltransferase involved in cellulose biosynthesis